MARIFGRMFSGFGTARRRRIGSTVGGLGVVGPVFTRQCGRNLVFPVLHSFQELNRLLDLWFHNSSPNRRVTCRNYAYSELRMERI